MPGEAGTGTGSESLQGGSSLRVSLNSAALLLWWFRLPWRAPPSLPSPQDVSSWPTAVLCLSLLSKPHVPAHSPCLHWRTPSQAGWAGQGSLPCAHFSVCPTRWLLCSLPRENEAALLSQQSSPQRGPSLDVETSPLFRSPQGFVGSIRLLFLFLFLHQSLVLRGSAGIFLVLSGVQVPLPMFYRTL